MHSPDPQIASFKQIKQKTRTAGARVCGIVEFLEEILCYLPMDEILFAQHVHRHFKAVIDGSRRIRIALFSVSEPQITPLEVRFNPLLRQMPLFNYCDIQVPIVGTLPLQLPADYSRPIDKLTDMPGKFFVADHHSFAIDIWRDNAGGDRRIPEPHGSWRAMYLTQPVCQTVIYRARRGTYDFVGKGVYTVGDLAKVLGPRKLRFTDGLAKHAQERDERRDEDDLEDADDLSEVLLYQCPRWKGLDGV
jgi:hypothetical protein